MWRVAPLLVLLFVAQVASANDLPPGALVRLGDDSFRAGGKIEHLVVSPDGKQFATTRRDERGTTVVAVWDAPTGRPLHEHRVNTELFQGLAWGPGGARAVVIRAEAGVGDKPGTLTPDDFRVWDFTDPKAKAPPPLPVKLAGFDGGSFVDAERPRGGAEYLDFLFSGGGTRLAARWTADGKHAVHVFESKPADTAAKLTRVGTIDLGAEGADWFRISADGKTVVTFRKLAQNEGLVATTWEVATGKPAKPVRVPAVPRLMLTPDASALVVFAAERDEWGFDLFELTTGNRRALTRWRYPAEQLDGDGPRDSGGFAFSPTGRELAIAVNRKTHVIDVTRGEELGRLEGHAGTHTAVAISADGARIATADDHGLIRLWDANTLRAVSDAAGHRAPVRDAELSPDGKRLLTWAEDKTVRLWDVATGKELRAFTGVTDYQPIFTPDGTAVVYRAKKSLIARDLQTGLEVPLPKNANELEPRKAIFSTDRLIASEARDGTEAWLCEANGAGLRRVFKGHRGDIRVLGFTPDGTKLLTAGGDHTVLVWDVRLQNVPLPDAIKKETNAAKLWDTLATGKADAAYLAMARLAREPDAAFKMAKMRLKPAPNGDRTTDAANLTDARAVELLEALDTDESRTFLKELAAGHADAFRTQEAKRALERHK